MRYLHVVARGLYAERQILWVFTRQADAEAWADRWNLDNLALIRNPGDEAVVDGTVELDPEVDR